MAWHKAIACTGKARARQDLKLEGLRLIAMGPSIPRLVTDLVHEEKRTSKEAFGMLKGRGADYAADERRGS